MRVPRNPEILTSSFVSLLRSGGSTSFTKYAQKSTSIYFNVSALGKRVLAASPNTLPSHAHAQKKRPRDNYKVSAPDSVASSILHYQLTSLTRQELTAGKTKCCDQAFSVIVLLNTDVARTLLFILFGEILQPNIRRESGIAQRGKQYTSVYSEHNNYI